MTGGSVNAELLASVRHRIGVGRIDAISDYRRRAVVRTIRTTCARMVVHPVGHEAIAIDAGKQVLRRTIAAAVTARKGQ